MQVLPEAKDFIDYLEGTNPTYKWLVYIYIVQILMPISLLQFEGHPTGPQVTFIVGLVGIDTSNHVDASEIPHCAPVGFVVELSKSLYDRFYIQPSQWCCASTSTINNYNRHTFSSY